MPIHSLGCTFIQIILYPMLTQPSLNARDMMRKRQNSGGIAVLDSRGFELSSYQVPASPGGGRSRLVRPQIHLFYI